MYENVVTNIKKQKNTSLFIFLGVALLLLFISLGLLIAKRDRKAEKATTKTPVQTTIDTKKNQTTEQYQQAQLSINGQTVPVLVPNNFPVVYDAGTNISFIIPNRQPFIFAPITQVCIKKEEPKPTQVTPAAAPIKIIPKKIIKKIEPKIESSSVSSSSSASSSNGQTSTSTSMSTQGSGTSSSSATAN